MFMIFVRVFLYYYSPPSLDLLFESFEYAIMNYFLFPSYLPFLYWSCSVGAPNKANLFYGFFSFLSDPSPSILEFLCHQWSNPIPILVYLFLYFNSLLQTRGLDVLVGKYCDPYFFFSILFFINFFLVRVSFLSFFILFYFNVFLG